MNGQVHHRINFYKDWCDIYLTSISIEYMTILNFYYFYTPKEISLKKGVDKVTIDNLKVSKIMEK